MVTSNVTSKKSSKPTHRKSPGSGGHGGFFRIDIRDKHQFVLFRTQDVGGKGGLERIAGKRKSGRRDTVTWLISKQGAHVSSGGRLIIDDPKQATVLDHIDGHIMHVRGDIFVARPRKNIPENNKPTAAMKKAQSANIKKAQAARKKFSSRKK